MIRDAVTCDRDGCLGTFLEPDDMRESSSIELEMDRAGWHATYFGHVCPACHAGRGPVLERGECPTCMGRTTDRAEGAVCLYCQAVVPHPADDLT